MALADPTNYGNAPGLGPLRPGGVPSPESLGPQSEKDLPSTLSKAAKAQRPDLEMVRDLEAGPSRIKSLGPIYLPRAPREEVPNYNSRLERSVFYNIFGHTAKGLTGFVFSKDPEMGDDVPPAIRGDEDGLGGHWENIDLAGTHGDVFLRDLFQDALVAGHAAILVEFPATDGTQSLAAEQSEIRPYWVPIKKDNLISWRTMVENGRTVLTQVVIREIQMVEDGEFGEREQTRYRVLYRRDGVVGWKLLEITERKEVILVDEGMYGNQVEIPLAEIVTSGRRSVFDSVPPLLDLAYLNLAHYRLWSDYETSLHLSCVPLLWEAGATDSYDADGNKIPRVVGPNTMFTYPDPNAKLGYAEHQGAGQAACKQALDDLKGDCASLGLAMMASQKRAAETAEARRIDKSGTDSQLSATARGLQDGVERALQFHARYLLEKDGGSIQINRDFEAELMEAPVMTAYANLVAAGFSKEMAMEMLKRGGRLPEDADTEQLALEWEAAAKAAEEAKRLEKEQQASDMADEARKAA